MAEYQANPLALAELGLGQVFDFHPYRAVQYFKTLGKNNPVSKRTIPIMKIPRVVVKLPEVGTPPSVEGIEVLGEGDGLGEGLATCPDGLAVKDGRSLVELVGEPTPSRLKPEEGVACGCSSGTVTFEEGRSDVPTGFISVKSWVCPNIIGGTGWAAPAAMVAEAKLPAPP